jgi:hypothetical protein
LLGSILALWVVGYHDLQIKKNANADSDRLEQAGRFEEAIATVDSAIEATWLLPQTALKKHRAALEFRAARPEVFGPRARDHHSGT